jgi:hypothetical protein
MRLEETRLSKNPCCGSHCRVEAFEVTYLQDCSAALGGFDYPVSFLDRTRDGFLDEDCYPGFQKLARYRAMRLGWDRQTDRVNISDKLMIICNECHAVSFSRRTTARLVDIAHCEQVCAGDFRVDSSVFASECPGPDYGNSNHFFIAGARV